MATKIQFKYGQWSHEAGCQMSIDNPGLVVFNGALQEIYVDGKTFGFSEAGLEELLERVETLEEFREAMRVEEYAQATVTTDSEAGTSDLLIAKIGQGTGAEGENDGKIYTSGNSLAIKLDGLYNDNEEAGDINLVATQSTVKTACDNLRAEILGTIDPEELEKTLDTIKEIQDVLLNGSYTIDHQTGVDPETGEPIYSTIHTEKVEVIDPETQQVTGYEYTNGADGDDKQVYATEDLSGNITYEEGYANIKAVASIDSLVASVEVSENINKGHVTATREDANVLIGVNYGTFKTGHGNVMDETSTAFVDGIATVADVQRYIEERLTWVSYETDANALATDLTHQAESGDPVNISNNADINQSMIIGQ